MTLAAFRSPLLSYAALTSFALALPSCVSSDAAADDDISSDNEMSSDDEPSPSGPVREGFEETEPGGLPRGWNAVGFGERTIGVTDARGLRSSRALRIEVPASEDPAGGMLARSNLGALAMAHFGRVYLAIQGPGVTEFVHFDAFEGRGPWQGVTNAVRWASTGTGVGAAPNNWSWIYNVQRSQGGEFGTEGDRSAHPIVDNWMCLEWRFDSAAQEAEFWFDGMPIEYLTLSESAGDRTEIPVFTSLAVGFQKFQDTDAFSVSIDDVAFDVERIGCDE